MRVDALASEPTYLAHLAPIWRAIPDEHRGSFACATSGTLERAQRLGLPGLLAKPLRSWHQPRDRLVMVASFSDLERCKGRRAVFVEHGAGQRYAGTPEAADSPYYAGGMQRDAVELFICPNRDVAAANAARYPDAACAVVGSPVLDELAVIRAAGEHLRQTEQRTVGCSFHWPGLRAAPESGWAWPDFHRAIAHEVAHGPHRWLGHVHHRADRKVDSVDIPRWWLDVGAVPCREWPDVVAEADVYVCDNSSTIFEAAWLGIPVVLLNAPHWRRDVEHGLRFWQRADIGVQVDHPDDLAAAIEHALSDPPERQAKRAHHAHAVYEMPTATTASEAAANAVVDLLRNRAYASRR